MYLLTRNYLYMCINTFNRSDNNKKSKYLIKREKEKHEAKVKEFDMDNRLISAIESLIPPANKYILVKDKIEIILSGFTVICVHLKAIDLALADDNNVRKFGTALGLHVCKCIYLLIIYIFFYKMYLNIYLI